MRFSKRIFQLITAGFCLFSLIGTAYSAPLFPGHNAPAFSLPDLNGKEHKLENMADHTMMILYFFDPSSLTSQEGLLSLDDIAKRYQDADLIVWGISKSPKDQTKAFVDKSEPIFPILIDQGNVSETYNARFVLPTVYILGPGLKVMDFFQGGGKATNKMLLRLAERELQQKNIMIARVITQEVSKKSPDNLEAKSLEGYAALKEGKTSEAESIFTELAKQDGSAGISGREGMAAVYASKGQSKKALSLANEVIAQDPDRIMAHKVRGDALLAQNKQEAAEEAYSRAVSTSSGPSHQQAESYNQLARLQAKSKNYSKARELYDQAIDINPYYVEATSNKGITYQKEGKWDEALASYQNAVTVDKADAFSQVLARKAAEMVAMQNDIARKERVDRLVKDLAERYRQQKTAGTKEEDEWTSRPLILTFVDFQEKGGMPERDGLALVLSAQLSDMLNASGRVQVVERVVMERLLEELNLGSSDLADKETALKLGKVLAAKMVGTGSLMYMGNSTLLNMRLIDTETSAIPMVVTRQIDTTNAMEKDIRELNRNILKTIIRKYPLQGYIAQINNEQVIINIGSRQGVVMGTDFEVVEQGEPIKYKGKVLKPAPHAVATLEVVKVEPDFCTAKVVSNERPVKKDDMIREKLVQSAI